METLTKRKNRSSNSSTNESPEQKKPRNTQNNTEQLHVDDEEEPLLTGPCIMSEADKMQETLQQILEKLGKLDAIEQSVNNIQANLLKLETRTETLESFQASATKDINDLKESLNFAEGKHSSKLESINKHNENINLKLTNLEKENQALNKKVADLETKRLYLEAYSRRENIKFENILEFEDGSDREDTEQVLRSFLETELGFLNASIVEIQRVHRLGKKKEGEPRPILARFLRYKDCEQILSLGRRLKDSNYKMYQDLPYEIVQRRKRQMPTLMKAKKNKIPAAFSKAQPDKLFIRGKLWPDGKTLEIS